MNYSLHPEALGDLRAAASFYREQAGTSRAQAFLIEFEQSINKLLLHAQTIKCRHAIEALDLGMEVLFPHTSFHDTSFDLFIRLTEGKLTFEEEEMLHALGIKF
jgi:plasmid stabilization system protein ParE